MNQEEYIEYLFRQYGSMVKKIVRNVVKNNHNIDDIIQETFIKLMENIDTIDNQKNLRSYICVIASNTSKDYLRRVSKSRELYCYDWNYLEGMEDTSNIIYDRVDYRLKKYVDRLPLEYSSVINCIYYNDMSVKEAADYLGIKQGTVRSRLYRGRKRLKVCIEKYSLCKC